MSESALGGGRPRLLLWAFPLVLQQGCFGRSYAVPESVAAERHQRSWLVMQEPKPEPPAAVPSAPAVAGRPPDPAPDAAFPLEAASPPAAAPEAPARFGTKEPEPDATATDQTTATATATEIETGTGSTTETGTETETETEAETTAQPPVASEPASNAATALAQGQVDLTAEMSREPDPSEQVPEPPKLRRMVWGLSMRLGGTFGADDLFFVEYNDGSTQTLTTGGGVNFFLGTHVTPFKVGSHTMTLGAEGGWKSSSIGEGTDAEVTFARKAFMPRVQYGYELTPGILWISGAGAQYEVDIELEAKGALVGSVKFDNALGYFGETGFLLDLGLFGLDLTFRHTWITYRSPGLPSYDGDSFGILGTIHIGLLKTENTAAANR